MSVSELLNIVGVVVFVGFFCLLFVGVNYVLLRHIINEMLQRGMAPEEIEEALREAEIYQQRRMR